VRLSSSSAEARDSGRLPMRLTVAAGAVMERRPPGTLVPRNRCAAVLHRRQACHDLPSCVQAWVRVTAAMKVPRDVADTGPGPCADCAAGQLASDRAVPARQGDQIAAALSGHSPGGPANGAR
jgi:hypothetical protein